MTVFRFADVRGGESDNHDPRRVGGFYSMNLLVPGYPVLTHKIRSSTPWPEDLTEALTAGLAQRGVQAIAVTDRIYTPGTAVGTSLILGGEIQNFSVEWRWTPQAHVGGIVRLWDQDGRLLVEKPIEARMLPKYGNTPPEDMLNAALATFVRQTVTDPDLTQRLVAAQP